MLKINAEKVAYDVLMDCRPVQTHSRLTSLATAVLVLVVNKLHLRTRIDQWNVDSNNDFYDYDLVVHL